MHLISLNCCICSSESAPFSLSIQFSHAFSFRRLLSFRASRYAKSPERMPPGLSRLHVLSILEKYCFLYPYAILTFFPIYYTAACLYSPLSSFSKTYSDSFPKNNSSEVLSQTRILPFISCIIHTSLSQLLFNM